MDNILIIYFQQFTTHARRESTALSDSMDIKEIKKGGFLLKRTAEHGNFFVLTGLVRQYTLTKARHLSVEEKK